MSKRIWSKLIIVAIIFATALASFTSPANFSHALDNGQAFVIASKCNLYNSADFTSDKVTYLDEEDQSVLITLKFNDSVTISDIQDDFAFVTTEKGHTGWMYKFYLTQNTSQDVYPVFNATIRTDTVIYDIEQNSTGKIATAGTRVFLYNGFDKTAELTPIQFALEDTTLYVGYISTKDIEPDGISKMLVVALTVIIAAVTIILSLLFIKKKTKKKKKKAETN